MGLNESFSHIRGHILLMEPLPPINKVFSFVIQEESQRAFFIGSMISNTVAMMTKFTSPMQFASP
jgi:hypothetical protein